MVYTSEVQLASGIQTCVPSSFHTAPRLPVLSTGSKLVESRDNSDISGNAGFSSEPRGTVANVLVVEYARSGGVKPSV